MPGGDKKPESSKKPGSPGSSKNPKQPAVGRFVPQAWGPNGGRAYVTRPSGKLGPGPVKVGHNSAATVSLERDSRESAERLRILGIDWDWSAIDLDVIGGSAEGSDRSVERVRWRFRQNLPTIVWDAAKLEGNTFTLPEVRTLLDGSTVEGKRLDDQNQVIALSEAYNELDRMVGDGTFALTKAISDRLHGIVARHEAIEAGQFRGEGSANGGGSVRLSTGGVVDGREHGEDGELLVEWFNNLLDYLDVIRDSRQRALIYAAAATRHQFYFDGNKRTAKLMASGVLMSAGYEAISVPFSRLYEQNVSLDRMFETNDATSYMRLLADCAR